MASRTSPRRTKRPADGLAPRIAGRTWLFAILGTSFLVKLMLAWRVRGIGCVADECDYGRVASGILAGRGFDISTGYEIRCVGAACDSAALAVGRAAGQALDFSQGYLFPPGLSYYLALCGRLWGDATAAGRVGQVVISTATVAAVYWIARSLYGRRVGLVAAAMFGFYPNLVAFSHLLWPATLFLLPFTLAFGFLLREPLPSPKSAACAGILLGLAALVKSFALYFTLVVALWLLLKGGRSGAWLWWTRPKTVLGTRALAAGIALGCAIATVAPWTVRNWIEYDRFVVLDTTLGRNLYLGNDFPPPASFDFPGRRHPRFLRRARPACTDPHFIDRDRCEVRNALAFIGSHPLITLQHVPEKLADLYTPMSFLIRHARMGSYERKFSAGEVRALTLVSALPWLAAALLCVAGLTLVRIRGTELIVLPLLVHLGVHSVTFGMSRFRMVVIPFVLIAGAPLLTRRLGPLLREAGPARITALVGASAALIYLWSLRWNELF